MSASSCPGFSVDKNDPSTYCGTESKGGSTCYDACCDEQKKYCENRWCGFTANPNKCYQDCIEERGCTQKRT